MNNKNHKQVSCIHQLSMIGLLEGISYLVLLLIAMPLKYYAGYPEAVKIAGWIHGILFTLFTLSVVRTQRLMYWKYSKTLAALMASILPFGTFVLNRRLKKEIQVAKKDEIYQ